MSRARRTMCLAVLSALALTAFLAPAALAKPGKLEVMTRNLYLGADLTPAITATSPFQLAQAGSEIWATVQATDFPARAEVLAQEIKQADPDLIGLQEAAIWRTGAPDGPPVLGGSPAGDVAYDYLETLLDELEEVGRAYVVVVRQQEADIEGPTLNGFDIRLTQQDVILAKEQLVETGKLSWTNATGAHYPAGTQLQLPLLGGLAVVESTRGYTYADMEHKQAGSFRFINTHLEAFSAGRRAQQAAALAAGPAAVPGSVVLVGDLNSDPANGGAGGADPTPNNLAYNILTGQAGFHDAAVQVGGVGGVGPTSGFNELVNDADTSGLDARIDHVLTRGASFPASKAEVTGTDPALRTDGGLWPSDHAGLLARIHP